MNAHSAVFEETIALERPVERINAGDRLSLALLSAGMLAGLVAYVTYDAASLQQLAPGEFLPSNLVKPPLYYAAYAMEIILVAAAGLFALVNANLRRIQRGFFIWLALLAGAAMLMAARGLAPAEFLSTKIVDGTGPVAIMISVLVFIGAKRSNWVVLEKIMFALTIVFSCLALYRMAGLQTFTRVEGFANLGNILNALYWPAAWLALRGFPSDSFVNRIKLIPIVIYTFASLFTQTRLNFVMVFALFVIYAIVQRKRRSPQAGLWIGLAMLAVWVALFTGIFLRDSRAIDHLQDVTSAFADRVAEDTRTEQLTAFFQAVAPSELILGRGSLATWDWDGYDWRGGTDLGYLTLLLYGGIPLLVTYIAVHVKPCVTALFGSASDWRLAGAGVGVLWAIRMFSSSYPGLSIDYYCVLFCVGAAISREAHA